MKPLVFGGKIESTPKFIYLKPGEHGVFVMTVSSNRQGQFTEKLDFLIVESKETVSFVLKGRIISPTLHFDRNVIDFGLIPVGKYQGFFLFGSILINFFLQVFLLPNK